MIYLNREQLLYVNHIKLHWAGRAGPHNGLWVEPRKEFWQKIRKSKSTTWTQYIFIYSGYIRTFSILFCRESLREDVYIQQPLDFVHPIRPKATPTCFLWKLVSFEFWFHQPKIDTYSSISHALKSLLIYNSKITLQNFFMLSPKLPYLYHTFFFSLFFYQYKCQIFTFFPFPPFFLSYKSHNIVFEFFIFFEKDTTLMKIWKLIKLLLIRMLCLFEGICDILYWIRWKVSEAI